MIENGSAYGVMIAMKHLLQLLEGNGVITTLEITEALDNALAELKRIPGLEGNAYADAARIVGGLYLPVE
jgi:hypothetical protein